jgi:hypothetical protein
MRLIRLIYISAATQPFNDEALAALLTQSRENNKKYDITGLLLYKNKTFIQLLEGEENQVFTLFNIIKQDRRHTATIRIREEVITHRDFGQWYMGFQNLDHYKQEQLPAYVEILDNQVDETKIEAIKGNALNLLLNFIK